MWGRGGAAKRRRRGGSWRRPRLFVIPWRSRNAAKAQTLESCVFDLRYDDRGKETDWILVALAERPWHGSVPFPL